MFAKVLKCRSVSAYENHCDRLLPVSREAGLQSGGISVHVQVSSCVVSSRAGGHWVNWVAFVFHWNLMLTVMPS